MERFVEVLVFWSTVGMILGLVLTFAMAPKVSPEMLEKYDLEKTMAKTKIGSVAFKLFIPLIITYLTSIIYLKKNTIQQGEPFLTLWVFMFFGFVQVRYVRKSRGYMQFTERGVGVIFLIIGFFWLR